ncbi:MAG: bifunctional 5,10-methylenetetrahydrofolate dehydrogenase/5,10-methenyltetrahydrofolate cyclohydrolase [Nitrospirota bacterium]
MAARLIDGRKVASDLKKDIKKDVLRLRSKGISPCLAVLYDTTTPRSKKYADLKRMACDEEGIDILVHAVQKKETEKSLINLIRRLNNVPEVNGILLQFPFRKIFNEKKIAEQITPEKDIDACGPYAMGRLFIDDPLFIPCTPYGAMKMLDTYRINPNRKRAVVIEGSSTGRSLAQLLMRRKAVVTICNAETINLKEECLMADILCVEAGNPGMVTADMVKKGAVVIDLGMNVTPEGKIKGDVDFDSVKKKASYITPVPGGSGPMTIAMILHNTVLAAKMQAKNNA